MKPKQNIKDHITG